MRYAELTMTPYTSVVRGIPIEAYTEAIEDARAAAERDHGVVLRWIYDIPGESGLESADATLSYALDHRPAALVGFGLGGPEIGVPRPQFEPHFTAARAAGLHSVPHSGESTGPQSVWDAITLLGAERIGHGTSSVQDPALLAHLAEHGIPLEVCPTSNIATRVVERLEEHPIRAMRDAGVVVTVNSDDPPMFGTTLNREYEIAAALLDLDAGGVADLAVAAVDASFAPDDVRTRVRDEIRAYAARSGGLTGAGQRSAEVTTTAPWPKVASAHAWSVPSSCTTVDEYRTGVLRAVDGEHARSRRTPWTTASHCVGVEGRGGDGGRGRLGDRVVERQRDRVRHREGQAVEVAGHRVGAPPRHRRAGSVCASGGLRSQSQPDSGMPSHCGGNDSATGPRQSAGGTVRRLEHRAHARDGAVGRRDREGRGGAWSPSVRRRGRWWSRTR